MKLKILIASLGVVAVAVGCVVMQQQHARREAAAAEQQRRERIEAERQKIAESEKKMLDAFTPTHGDDVELRRKIREERAKEKSAAQHKLNTSNP